jgi:hypothetical protein
MFIGRTRGTEINPVTKINTKNGAVIGVEIDGKPFVGFAHSSPRRLKVEFPGQALPGYI